MNRCASKTYVMHNLLSDLQMLKHMLHALLIPGTLSFLSVASNRRLKAPAFRVIGAYVSKVSAFTLISRGNVNPVTGHYPPVSGLIPELIRQKVSRICRGCVDRGFGARATVAAIGRLLIAPAGLRGTV